MKAVRFDGNDSEDAPVVDKDFLNEVNKFSNALVLSTSDGDDKITVWEAKNRGVYNTFRHPKFTFEHDALISTSHMGGYIIACHSSKTQITVWKWDHPDSYCSFASREKVHCLKAFGDGVYIAAGTASGRIFIWETQTGKLIADVPAHYGKITQL